MGKEYAYIRTQPKSVSFWLKQEPGNIQISFNAGETRLNINQGLDKIVVNVHDIEWLRQVLDDINSFYKMREQEEPTTK